MRIEYKYFVPCQIKGQLLRDIKLFVDNDHNINSDRESYTVASIYFDNIFYKCYDDKEAGLQSRNKVRIRFYPDSEGNFFANLEIKGKRFDKGFKVKHLLNLELVKLILANRNISEIERANVSDDGLIDTIKYFRSENMFPVVRIDYQRFAFTGRADKEIRVTIDQDIKCCASTCLDDKAILPIPMNGNLLSILEIKSRDYIPFWLNSILDKYGCQRMAISKYGMAIERLSQFDQLFNRATNTKWT